MYEIPLELDRLSHPGAQPSSTSCWSSDELPRDKGVARPAARGLRGRSLPPAESQHGFRVKNLRRLPRPGSWRAPNRDGFALTACADEPIPKEGPLHGVAGIYCLSLTHRSDEGGVVELLADMVLQHRQHAGAGEDYHPGRR